MTEEKNKKTRKEWWEDYGKITIATIISLLSIGLIIFVNYYFFVGKPTDTRGTFGDMFGLSNAIFSALAFVGIIVTIFLQSQELAEQREELKLTRKEFNQQNETLSLQRFENTFFQLLGVHHGIVDGMEYKYNEFNFFMHTNVDITILKREVFKKAFENLIKGTFVIEESQNDFELKLNSDLIEHHYELNQVNGKQLKEIFTQVYGKQIYYQVQSNFGHYFRNLYRLLKFIDSKEFYSNEEVKKFYEKDNLNKRELSDAYFYLNNNKRYEYTSLVRAQLSDYELWWLTFNGLWKEGEKLKALVEKYTILKNHPSEKVMWKLNEIELYERSAFKKEYNTNLHNFKKYNEKLQEDFEKHPNVLNVFNEEEANYMKGSELMSRFINAKK